MQIQDPGEAIRQAASIMALHQEFVLTTHVNPDGDGLGSELALAWALRQMGKSVSILNHSSTPENYRWLDPGQDLVQFSSDRDRQTLLKADCIVVLDTNHPARLPSLEEPLRAAKGVKIVVDHHLDPDPFADRYVIDDGATSTGEIVYRILKELPGVSITKEIARALYTAIMTDTGSFRYPRTDPEIHLIAAHLIERGADPTSIFENVYENWSPGRLRLLGEVLDSMKIAHDGKLAYIVCTQKMFSATGTTGVDTDNFTTFPMGVRGVLVGILFNELENGVKISFRSKGRIPVNELAKEFGGNGHLNAAGARLFDARLDAVVPEVVARAKKYVAGSSTEGIKS
ncbi:MAG TPA: bifunctional oligoribonuclease/PAP phosphatase NrnA [Bacteroidota bacterium]|jgi:phosphoesterase RecJ-like protein